MAHEDDEILVGGPGDEGKGAPEGGKGEEKSPAGPKMVNVGGVEVPEEVAAYLTPLVEQFTGRISQLEGQLALASAPKSVPTSVDDYDFNTKIFEEPAEALARLEKKIKEELKAELAQKTTAESNERAFWDAFYGDNPDLKEHDFIVKAVLQRDLPKLANLNVDAAIKAIAAETKKVVLKSTNTKKVDGVTLESGGGPRKAAPPREETSEADFSASSFLRSRRAARHSSKQT